MIHTQVWTLSSTSTGSHNDVMMTSPSSKSLYVCIVELSVTMTTRSSWRIGKYCGTQHLLKSQTDTKRNHHGSLAHTHTHTHTHTQLSENMIQTCTPALNNEREVATGTVSMRHPLNKTSEVLEEEEECAMSPPYRSTNCFRLGSNV